jgi:ribonucleoside-diphosphate reductase beta chain
VKRNLTTKTGQLNKKDLYEMHLKEKPLFNSNVSEEQVCIILGQNTNLLVLEDTKFEWGVKLYDAMVNARWTKEDVNMSQEATTYLRLSQHEKEAYDGTLSFLTFLDSLQVNNLSSNVSSYISAPEITLCFAEQTAIEAQHSYIYQHIYQSLKLKREEILDIYYKWETIPILKERNDYIAQIYQDFQDDPTLHKYIKALIADLLLEGLYFYNGFAFFYSLAARGLMMGTSGDIKLINKDELYHTILFQNTMNEIVKLFDNEAKAEIYNIMFEMLDVAINQEIEWATLMYGGGKILGFTDMSIIAYTKNLAWRNIVKPTIDPSYLDSTLFSKYKQLEEIKNPYAHIDKIANLEGGDAKGGFFETNNVDYLTVSIFDDFGSL